MLTRSFILVLPIFIFLQAADADTTKFPRELLKSVLEKEPYERLQLLGQVSDSPEYLTRTYLGPAHRRAAQMIKGWMEETGMRSWVDVIGNVHGVIPGRLGGPEVVLGSHYDSVVDAGKYDGPLGIITAIAAVKYVVLQALMGKNQSLFEELVGITAGDQSRNSLQPNTLLPQSLASQLLEHPVHVVAFCDEEGVRFQSTFLGSRALTGAVLRNNMLESRDMEGTSLKDVLQQEAEEGVDVEAAVASLALQPQTVRQYVEVHIEQGPVLEQQRVALGVVTAIAGQTRLWVTVEGVQGHAGTVPMAIRRDALAGASLMIHTIEQQCAPTRPLQEDTEQLVCTVGELRVYPNAVNIIPRYANFSVDIRSRTDVVRQSIVEKVKEKILEVCASRGLSCSVEQRHDAPAVAAADEIVEGLAAAVVDSKSILSAMGHSADEKTSGMDKEVCSVPGLAGVPRLVSGAGHDAMAMAELTKMGMMFVRCAGGISHNPLEDVQEEDVGVATAALASYLTNQLLKAQAK